ncbi:MAG: hypothetical protein K0U34_08060, partial [Alphaproteobacteria bacterium]|nr:hypothetical protein [Alphaproteobacteria bacterium]
DLYRARQFPNDWVHEARLVDQPVHDATLHFSGDRWWLFAATEYRKSSTWCALSVFHAKDLLGPWVAFDPFPVKSDVRSSRPAGSLIVLDRQLWRPTQNCSDGYGASLTWCRIDHLTPGQFSEKSLGSLQFTDRSGIWGPHTWTATEDVETIDLFASPQALPQRHSNSGDTP